jgi:thioredoxin-like negative regulator of GroEL
MGKREHATASSAATVSTVRGKPRLLLFHSRLSGRCRRVDGFLAQVLQRRSNHATFELERIDAEELPELHESFGIDEVPTIVVVEGGEVRGRIVDPTGCKAIERFLAPWLN